MTTDVVVFALSGDELQVLTVTRQREPYAGSRALPGVYVARDETVEQAADRCLRTKAGLASPPGSFRRTIGVHDSIGRDPRGHALSVVHVVVWPTGSSTDGERPAEATEWVDAAAVSGLAFDHDEIVRDAREWLAVSMWSNAEVLRAAVGQSVLSTSTLVRIATAVDGGAPNISNLRRRVAASGLLVPTDEKIVGAGRGRPSTGWAWA